MDKTIPAPDFPPAPLPEDEAPARTNVEPLPAPRAAAPSIAAIEDPAPGTLLADRYRIVRKIGEGGMGAVYEATHESLRKRVALKLLSGPRMLDKEAIARFEREAFASANLRHPNIVEATDFGKLPSGALYLVMEYVEGRTLRSLLEETPRAIDQPRAMHLLRQVAAAVSRAHAAGVVHRDLKPENILVIEAPGTPDLVKVIDFGIARVSGGALGPKTPALTLSGAVFGTPDYMAPEQAMGQPADARADQYAFGVIAYELLSGKLPFDDEDAGRVLMKHITAAVPEIRTIAPGLPPAISPVLARCLAKKAQDRWPDIDAAFLALEQAFAGADDRGAGPASDGRTVRLQAPSTPQAQPQSMPVVQPQSMPVAQPQSMPVAQPQSMPVAQPQSVPVVQPSSMPVVQPQSMPVGRPQGAPAMGEVGRPQSRNKRSGPQVSPRTLAWAGAAVGALLVLVGIVFLAFSLTRDKPPEQVASALDLWTDGQYETAESAFRTALPASPSFRPDKAVAEKILTAMASDKGRRALGRLLSDTSFGQSEALLGALAIVAIEGRGVEKTTALRLLRGRQSFVAAGLQRRLALRDADDCVALRGAADALASAEDRDGKEDLDGLRDVACREVLRRDELCGCAFLREWPE